MTKEQVLQIEERNSKLEEATFNSRNEWRIKFESLIPMIRELRNLSEAQVMMLSYRHQIIEKVSEMNINIIKVKSNYDTQYKVKYDEYKRNYDVKLNGGETNRYITADLSPLSKQVSILECHLDFYKECVRTLDNLGHAVRNRIKLADEDF